MVYTHTKSTCSVNVSASSVSSMHFEWGDDLSAPLPILQRLLVSVEEAGLRYGSKSEFNWLMLPGTAENFLCTLYCSTVSATMLWMFHTLLERRPAAWQEAPGFLLRSPKEGSTFQCLACVAVLCLLDVTEINFFLKSRADFCIQSLWRRIQHPRAAE